MKEKTKKILKVVGGGIFASLALLGGLPLQQENISQTCAEPIPNNISLNNDSIDCGKIPMQLSHDLGTLISGSVITLSGPVALNSFGDIN